MKKRDLKLSSRNQANFDGLNAGRQHFYTGQICAVLEADHFKERA